MSAAVWVTQKVYWKAWCHQQRHSLHTRELVRLPLPSSLHHLKDASSSSLEIFPTGCSLPEIISTINLCFSFILIETPLIKCLTAVQHSKYPLLPCPNKRSSRFLWTKGNQTRKWTYTSIFSLLNKRGDRQTVSPWQKSRQALLSSFSTRTWVLNIHVCIFIVQF